MTLKTIVAAYAVLMLLLAATAMVHTFQIGVWNVLLNMGFATAKAVIIALVFMHLWREIDLIRAFSVVGVIWLSLLVILSLADYLHRDHPSPFYGTAFPPPAVERSLLGVR